MNYFVISRPGNFKGKFFQALHLQKKKILTCPFMYVCVYLFPFLWELQKFIYTKYSICNFREQNKQLNN